MSRKRGSRAAREQAAARVLVNVRHASRRRKLAIQLTVVGFVILTAGLIFGSRSPERLFLGYGALVLGSIISWAGIAFLDRWVALPRQEDALAKALGATIEDAEHAFATTEGRGARIGAARFTLYSWLLPADHVVAAPWGLAVLDVNAHDGPVEIDGARWKDRRPIFKRLFSIGRRPVRNPQRWLGHEIRALREAIAAADQSLADVPIEPAAVFARERTVINVTDAEPATMRVDELSAWLRLRSSAHPALVPAERRRLLEVLDGLAAARVAPKVVSTDATSGSS